MLRNIDFSNEVSIPNLYLCKPNCDTIASLSESFNIKFKLNYGNINELEFDIPTKIDRITTSGYELIDNPHIELLRYSYLIKFIYNDSTEYFVIDKSEEEMNEDLDVKHIQCYSLAKEMENQLIINYEATSYNLQQVLEELFVELYEVSSASEALWTLNYIHPSFLNTYRQFKVAKKTLIEFILSDIKETFNCIPIFDTVNRQISFYRDEDYGANRGLIFDYGKYLKTINKSLETEEFCTVFKPFGNENLTISGVNPTGKNYLQDYSYFLYPYEEDELGNVVASSYYMSDSLCGSILDYNDLLEEKQGISDVAEDGTTITNIKMTSHGLVDGDWIVNRTRNNAYRKVIKIDDNNVIATSIADQTSGDTIIKYSDGTFRKLLFEEEEFQTELTTLETELVALQDELIILLDNVAICEETGGSFGGHDLTYWITQRDNKEIEIDSKKTSIDTKKAEIYSIKYEITVTNGATSDGDITFTIDGTDIVVAVNSGDSTSDVATKINTAFNELYDFNGLLYKSSVDSSVVTLCYYVVDDKADIITIFVDTDITGVTTSISDTNFGKSNLISKLQNDISMETNFTLVQRQELNQFKKVKEWEDSNYTDALDLYYDAKNKFVEINSPKIIFDIDIVNFLECIEEQINWEKLNLGDTVTIKYSIFNINETAKILNIEFDFENRNVNLTIGNVTKIKNAKDKFLDELYKSIHTSNEVNIDKASWNTAINNFNSDNDSISSIPVSPTVANDGTAITHTVNTDGSVNIKFTWEFSGVEFFIDGFQVRVRSSSSSKPYTFGSTLAEENIIEVDSSKRSIGIEGVPADNYYTFGIRSFRKVRADITSSGVLYSDVVKSSYANDNPYLPSATVNYTGNINGTPASDFTDFLSVTYPNLQDQIDGKIMSWFQDSNPNTWTEADRLKHNGDMWYSSSTKLLKRYDGITNSWTTIEDQKAIDAYTAASTAQDTADNKRRVFVATPTPPYDVGDLWTEGSTGDLKRCKTAKESGSYSADDWELATKYTDDSTAINALSAAANAQEAADGQIQGFFQPGAPSIFNESTQTGDAYFGDIWIDTTTEPPTDSNIYRCEDASQGSTGTLSWYPAPTNAIGLVYLDAYNAQHEVDSVKDNIVYKVEIISSNGNVFKNGQIFSTLEARVYHGVNDVTATIDANRFRWTRVSDDESGDAAWNSAHFSGTKSVSITPSDVPIRATFQCSILSEE